MKTKNYISVVSILAAGMASALALNVSSDTVVDNVAGVISFTGTEDATLTITGTWNRIWYSPRSGEGVTSKGTIYLAEGATMYFDVSGDTGKELFGNNGVSKGTGDLVITGLGKIVSDYDSITTRNTNSKLYVGAETDFSKAAYSIQGSNLTVSNVFAAKKLTTDASSVLNLVSGANFSSAESAALAGTLNVQGGSLALTSGGSLTGTLNLSSGNITSGKNLDVRGTLKQTGGKYLITNASTVVYKGGVLDLGVEKGFVTRWVNLSGGSTVIFRAKNALVQDEAGTPRVLALQGAADGNITMKMYADQTFNTLWFSSSDIVVDLYTNGNAITFSGINYAEGANNGTFNIFIEEGFEWQNDKIHFTNATAELVEATLGTITIDGKVIDSSQYRFDSDGANGIYLNIVPEPATYAAIFGALAIAFAFVRRRK